MQSVAKTVDAYVAQAVRLIDDAAWRNSCASAITAGDLDAAFFKGDASLFGDALADLISRARRP